MNIIWLTPEIPYPPIGGRNGVFNRIKQLSKYNNIYLYSIAYNQDELELIDSMKTYCTDVHYYDRSKDKVWNILRSLIMPFSAASRSNGEMQNDIRSLMNQKKIDVVICDFPNMSENLKKIDLDGIYCTLNEHNIEYKRMREMSEAKNISRIKRIAYYLESFRLESYEKRLYKSSMFQSYTFFSSDDMKFFRKKWNIEESKLRLFPLGANIDIPNLEVAKSDQKNLLFIGRLDDVAVPNVEAVLWFYKHVWPLVLRQVPDAKLIIGGANPSEQILKLSSEKIEVVGNFKRVEEMYSRARCVILPLLSGGGVKGKLLEAIALKKIVITTDHGIEGTKFINEKHVLLANDAQTFAGKCVSALEKYEQYREMIEEAYKLFNADYNWESIGKAYNSFLVSEVNH